MSLLSPPFGPLNFVHQYILTNAQPITYQNWYYVFIVPFLPLGLQCLLVQYPYTQPYRIAIAVLGVSLMLHTWASYRFDEYEYNAFNDGLGITWLHLSGKYIEFAARNEPLVDPYVAKGRSHLLAATDLAINSRKVGLGLQPNQQGRGKMDGGVKVDVQKSIPADSSKERWLPYARVKRTKLQALTRHAVKGIAHYVVLDTLLGLIRTFGTGGIANSRGGPSGTTYAFMRYTPFYLLPRSAHPIKAPYWVVSTMTKLSVGAGVWQGISWGYHMFALVAVGTGLWETESWEVDMFDNPLVADSLLDLWGRRWHQLFRHHFLSLSTLILRSLGLSANSPLLLPLIFFFSGCLHALGQLSMSPVPAPLPIAGFFFLSGVGVAFELCFKKLTGRRVQGFLGRVWAWTWMLGTAGLAVEAWLDAGMGGSRLTPVEVGGWATPGVHLARWARKWIVDVKMV